MIEVMQITLTGPGVCARCGCTDGWACDGGCYWANAEHTLCSACVRQSAETVERVEHVEHVEIDKVHT